MCPRVPADGLVAPGSGLAEDQGGAGRASAPVTLRVGNPARTGALALPAHQAAAEPRTPLAPLPGGLILLSWKRRRSGGRKRAIS